MACGCGKGRVASGSAGRVEYVVTAPNGTQQTYRTEIEARAALTRFGGGSIQQKTVT